MAQISKHAENHFGHLRPEIVLLSFSLIRARLIDQHDRDVIFDLIDQVTRFADQTVSGLVQEDLSFTFRTGQDF